ncbi:unnamed protein product [Oncorhynchus mykiss]|uniref:Uncharacterized protein n=1 Tax=Oncorhynchus mykiss TaxID=8022 RepID=A0A060YBH6_ONCMY|nr:unnamed protein product [Oncorhynchus mykiss]
MELFLSPPVPSLSIPPPPQILPRLSPPTALQWLRGARPPGQSCGVCRVGGLRQAVAPDLLRVFRVWRGSGGSCVLLEGGRAALWKTLLPEDQTTLFGCDELIFCEDYKKGGDGQAWHQDHYCCWRCGQSLDSPCSCPQTPSPKPV